MTNHCLFEFTYDFVLRNITNPNQEKQQQPLTLRLVWTSPLLVI